MVYLFIFFGIYFYFADDSEVLVLSTVSLEENCKLKVVPQQQESEHNMSLHPDLSDPALLQAFDDVRSESSPTNWYYLSNQHF